MTAYNDFIYQLKFKGVWRSYQKRVLDELELHLDDNKLNVVAAPGAGKTTLGIEVMLRMKQPALILAPTITIKSQWKERIIENFLPDDFDSDFISTDIKNIKPITISTYQGLHSIYKNQKDKSILLKALKDNSVSTLVLDEAHHLRTEWWLTLFNLYEEIYSYNKNIKTVSLTGTPPYDVPPAEWENYNSLCGPVDAEISIPELVKAGDLAPHQDSIYFSDLTSEENKTVYNFAEKRVEFFKYLKENSDLLYAVEGSVFINDIDNNVDIIYQNPDFTVSVVSYLLYEDELNISARILAEFLGLTVEQIPKFNYKTAEILLNGIVGQFREYFKNVIQIKSKLKEYGLINGNKVDLSGNTDFKKLFARSKNKLNAIYDITGFEYKNLKENLHEVILLDYIGKGDSEGLNIVSVFNKLLPLNISAGILTGTLVVIPQSAKEKLYSILEERNIDKNSVIAVEFQKDYLRLETYGNIDIVSIVTELFEKGYIKVLAGTAALLGEGWDSPCVNTLIIASVVGSFMLSNQMRGRALIIDKNNPEKNSDIWHLVSLTENEEDSPDFLTAEKRFNTFEGISYNENKIQNGIERLGLDLDSIYSKNCDKYNKIMFGYAAARKNLAQKWTQVFHQSSITEKRLAPKIYDAALGGKTQSTVLFDNIPKWLPGLDCVIKNYSINPKKAQLGKLESLILRVCSRYNLIPNNYEDIIKENYRIYTNQNILKNIAYSLLKTMNDLSVIKTDLEKIHLEINDELNSKFYITINGCTNYESSLFIKSFGEIFKIRANSRYIIKFTRYQDAKTVYIAAPECIAGHNRNVKQFSKYLKPPLELSDCDIIYTRNPKGYRELLKAKYNAADFGYEKQSRVWL